MRFCALASGSSGNCIYVGHDNTHILVDAGISGKKIEAALAGLGIAPESIGGIVVTHDHSDHTQAAAIMSRRFGIDLYATAGTLEYIVKNAKAVPPNSKMHEISPEKVFSIGGIEITPFRTTHDAVDPVNYTLSADGRKLAMATDLGEYDENVIRHLSGADALYIEANHDVNMLMLGTYPYPLKQRINSPLGHLSNEACAELVRSVRSSRLRAVVLAHISKDNNFEELAYETVRLTLDGDERFEGMPKLMVANRYTPSEMIEL